MRTNIVLVLVWLALSSLAWFTLVPGFMSQTTCLLLSGTLLAAGMVLVRFIHSSEPTRSLAGMLYDTEQGRPDKAR